MNFSRGSNMVGSTWDCIQFFKIKAGAQLKPVLADLNHGSNSLNSDTGLTNNQPNFFARTTLPKVKKNLPAAPSMQNVSLWGLLCTAV